MNRQRERGDRGKDKLPRKRRSEAEIKRDKARVNASAIQARTNSLNAFARAGIIIPAQLQDHQGESIASADQTVEPAPPVSQVPTRKDYDEIEILEDEFFGDDEDDDTEGIFDDLESFCALETLMGECITALKREVAKELMQTDPEPATWLLTHLRSNGFIVRAESAHYICSKLPTLTYSWNNKEYYRDVRFWLPDVEHGIKIPCPNGCGDHTTGNHGFAYNHPGRRVRTIDSCYYLVTRRYMCRECGKTEVDANKYTFRGWNLQSMTRLPRNLILDFPAFLTRKGAVDLSVIHLMRPLVALGVRPGQFAAVVSELHKKRYCERFLRHEHELKGTVKGMGQVKRFSQFSDEKGYYGKIPSPGYFDSVFKQHHSSIREHLDKQMKMRSGETLNIDTSYKVAKMMPNHNGTPVYQGTVTVTNDYGEIRSQWNLTSDSTDQYEAPLTRMKITMDQYGHPHPTGFMTDNPRPVESFLFRTFPSIKARQDCLNAMLVRKENCETDPPSAAEVGTPVAESLADEEVRNEEFGAADVNGKPYTYLRTIERMNVCAEALRAIILDRPPNERFLSLDAEWEVDPTRVGSQCRIALLQVSYWEEDTSIKSHLYHVRESTKKIPTKILALLTEPSFVFVGVSISGDVSKLRRDFPDCFMNKTINCLDIAKMARRRGVKPRGGSCSLKNLAEELLGINMDKGACLTSWNATSLTTQQLEYAHKDVEMGLALYKKLVMMADLTLPLQKSACSEGRNVDISPAHGSLGQLSSLAAHGMVLPDKKNWSPPAQLGFKTREVTISSTNVLVHITKVFAPKVTIKGLKNHLGRQATLGDFLVDSFDTVLPITMLRDRCDNRVELSATVSGGGELLQPVEVHQPGISIVQSTKCGNCDNGILDVDHIYGVDDCNDNDEADIVGVFLDGEDSDDDHLEEVDNASAIMLDQINKVFHDEPWNEIQHWPVGAEKTGVYLDDPPPDGVTDAFRAVQADAFHVLNRIYISRKHECHKSFYVAFSEAVLCWNKNRMRLVEDRLVKDGLSDKAIKSLRYFKTEWFQARVDRTILPPSRLYWRVRAVFELFGPKKDSTTKKPLFDRPAWTKAKQILRDICDGYLSDHPDKSYYRYKMKNGRILIDKLGLEILECSRGTNDVENCHKYMARIARPSVMGFELCDAIMAEHCHRGNQRASQRRRPDFPSIGHYDPWLVDGLQNIIEETRGSLYCSGWANASDYLNTDETFGVVPLASSTLIEKINSLEIQELHLPRDKRFYAVRTGLAIPALPFTTLSEKKMYPKLVLEVQRTGIQLYNGMSDDEAICHAILPHVDGIEVFPKLAVYVRLYERKWSQNSKARDSSRRMEVELEQLHLVNEATHRPSQGNLVATGTIRAVQALEGAAGALTIGVAEASQWQNTSDGTVFAGAPPFGQLYQPIAPALPATFVGIFGRNVACIPGPVVIGNARIDIGSSYSAELLAAGTLSGSKHGQDGRKRATRTCRRCGRNGLECAGAKAGRFTKGAEDCKQNTKIDGSPIVCKVCGKVGFDAEQTCPGAKMSRDGWFQRCIK